MEDPLRATPFKGKLLYTIKILLPMLPMVLFGRFIGSYLSDDPERLEQFWRELPEQFIGFSIMLLFAAIIGILGWYLGDYLQKKK